MGAVKIDKKKSVLHFDADGVFWGFIMVMLSAN